MKTLVILIPTTYHNARKVCENIQERVIECEVTAGFTEHSQENEINDQVRKDIFTFAGETDTKDPDEVNAPKGDMDLFIYPMTDFMDDMNDEMIDMDAYFMSYVFVKTSEIMKLGESLKDG